jgi:hypothetical protein
VSSCFGTNVPYSALFLRTLEALRLSSLGD